MPKCYHRFTVLVPVDPERGLFLVAGLGLSAEGAGDEEVETIDIIDARIVDNGEAARTTLDVAGRNRVDLTAVARSG